MTSSSTISYRRFPVRCCCSCCGRRCGGSAGTGEGALLSPAPAPAPPPPKKRPPPPPFPPLPLPLPPRFSIAMSCWDAEMSVGGKGAGLGDAACTGRVILGMWRGGGRGRGSLVGPPPFLAGMPPRGASLRITLGWTLAYCIVRWCRLSQTRPVVICVLGQVSRVQRRRASFDAKPWGGGGGVSRPRITT